MVLSRGGGGRGRILCNSYWHLVVNIMFFFRFFSVTFNQKNAYTRRFLQDSDGWIGRWI